MSDSTTRNETPTEGAAFKRRVKNAADDIRAGRAVVTVDVEGCDDESAVGYSRGEISPLTLLDEMTPESPLGFRKAGPGRYEIAPREKIVANHRRARRARKAGKKPGQGKEVRELEEKMWTPEAREAVLAAYPEMRDRYERVERRIKQARCPSCVKRARTRALFRTMASLGRDGRDLSALRVSLGDVVVDAVLAESAAEAERPGPRPTERIPLGRPGDDSLGGVETGTRPACVDCFRKHLAQAVILLNEGLLGYPNHRWLAVGHLAEASEEILRSHPDVANDVREVRLRVMDEPTHTPDLMSFFDRVSEPPETN